MVKVPGTIAALPAIEDLLAAGVNVNVTLLFSVARYERVALAYLAALERRRAAGQAIDRLASVASFFVGRVDGLVDALLIGKLAATSDPTEAARLAALRGRGGIANARLAYARFRELVAGPRWAALRAAGARLQRPLWASTSVKDPTVRDTRYVEALIGPDTVNTMPAATLDALRRHGIVRRTVDEDPEEAAEVLRELAALGIDLDVVAGRLEEEGIAAFARSFAAIIAGVEARRRALAEQAAKWIDLGAASAVQHPW
jgi:transaldolase